MHVPMPSFVTQSCLMVLAYDAEFQRRHFLIRLFPLLGRRQGAQTRLLLSAADALPPRGGGGAQRLKKVRVPETHLKFPASLMNFAFPLRKVFLMWGDGSAGWGCPGPQTTPAPSGSPSNGLVQTLPPEGGVP